MSVSFTRKLLLTVGIGHQNQSKRPLQQLLIQQQVSLFVKVKLMSTLSSFISILSSSPPSLSLFMLFMHPSLDIRQCPQNPQVLGLSLLISIC